MFFEGNRITAVREMIMADTRAEEGARQAAADAARRFRRACSASWRGCR